MVAALMVTATLATARLAPRFGSRPLVPAGMLLAAVGMFLLTRLGVDSTYVANILPALLPLGLGMGLIFAPSMSAATAGVATSDAGVASAMVNTTQQVGGAIGTALLNTLFAAAITDYVATHGGRRGHSGRGRDLRLQHRLRLGDRHLHRRRVHHRADPAERRSGAGSGSGARGRVRPLAAPPGVRRARCVPDPGMCSEDAVRSLLTSAPPGRRDNRMTSHQVTAKDVAARPTAVVPAATTWREYPALWRELLDEVWACLRAGGIERGCRNVMLYLDDVPHVEVGVELSRPCPLTGRVVASALPAGKVAMTVHHGSYAALGSAHQAVLDWCAGEGLRPAGPRWEVYGPHDPDPAQVWTEVYYLLAP